MQQEVKVINLTIASDESVAFVGDLHMDSACPVSRIDNFMVTTCQKVADIREKSIQHNVKAIFFSGDIFSRITTSNESINMLGIELLKFREAGIQVFTIAGNHDIPRNNIEYLIKSPLSLLINFGVITHINTMNRVIINKKGLITPVDYTESIPYAAKNAKYNILLAHVFYEAGDLIAGKSNIKKEDVAGLGYNCMWLGHDHVRYPMINVDGTDIVRPGSVTRGTSHDYNITQTPVFYILSGLDDYNSYNLKCVDIACMPSDQIFSSVVLNKKDKLSNLNSLISDLVDRLSDKDMTSTGNSISEIVKSDKDLEVEVKELLLGYFSRAGIMI